MSHAIEPPIFAGERRTFTVDHNFEETKDLLALPAGSVKFYSRRLDGTVGVNGQTATFSDVTPSEAGVPPKSVWRLSYKPTASEVAGVGEYRAVFRVDFAPDGSDPDFIPEPPGLSYQIVAAI